jgi:hypothetical protein
MDAGLAFPKRCRPFEFEAIACGSKVNPQAIIRFTMDQVEHLRHSSRGRHREGWFWSGYVGYHSIAGEDGI